MDAVVNNNPLKVNIQADIVRFKALFKIIYLGYLQLVDVDAERLVKDVDTILSKQETILDAISDQAVQTIQNKITAVHSMAKSPVDVRTRRSEIQQLTHDAMIQCQLVIDRLNKMALQ